MARPAAGWGDSMNIGMADRIIDQGSAIFVAISAKLHRNLLHQSSGVLMMAGKAVCLKIS
jgi:hypothetical protein